MKDTVKEILIYLGTIILLGTAAFFPFPSLYAFVLNDASEVSSLIAMNVSHMASHIPFYYDVDLFINTLRLKATLGAVGVAVVMIVLMFFLKKACRKLALVLFNKALKWGIFYVGIITVLMIAGMWLDLKPFIDCSDPKYPSGYIRVGFLFYSFIW